ncbi:hypothetical protein CLF_105890 [Clonorchis sinensis]|uniref:Retrotransposon gag domain-containing protein n=1 Tax=Clonorchis sinensis TaxID=79923 RepID=G7YPI4_CLOSI|nr:hypothetical protein CLF_105890 [Clonorchis sinensis]
MDWTAAKEALAAEFDTTADRQEAMRRFKTARMAPGCDPTVFFASLQRSLDRALPGLERVSAPPVVFRPVRRRCAAGAWCPVAVGESNWPVECGAPGASGTGVGRGAIGHVSIAGAQAGFNSGGPAEQSGSTYRTACSRQDGIAEARSNEPMLQVWHAWPLEKSMPSYPTTCT